MLKDRRVLIEESISKLTKRCGQLYLSHLLSEPTQFERDEYHSMVDELGTLKIELHIVEDMIKAGHE